MQLKMYNSIYKHDFICLSKTYLDSVTFDTLLEIEGYNLVCTDHLNNIKREVEFALTTNSHFLFKLEVCLTYVKHYS